MKYYILTTLIFLMYLPLANAQNTKLNREDLTDFVNTGGVLRTTSVTEYKGTPYFNEWAKGHVVLDKNTVTESMSLRYDMEYDAILFTRDDKLYSISHNKMDGFVIYTTDGDITFRNGFRTDKDDIGFNTLLRVIYDGDIKLVAHHTSTLQENMPTYGTATSRSEFVNDSNYFLVTADGTFHEVKLKRNDILDVLSDKKNKLRKYAESNNLDYDEEPELKKILGEYDRLTSSSSDQ